MRQFLLPGGIKPGGLYTAEGADYHYLARVLRAREGMRFPAGDPAGGRFLLILLKREKNKLVFRVQKEENAADTRGKAVEAALEPPEPELVLLVCLPQPAKMDLIVRMATEIGVNRVAPLISDFSPLSAQEARRLGDRRGRWEKIARAAYQQCGRPELPVLEEVGFLSELEARSPQGEVCLFADETGGATRSLHELLSALPPGRVRSLVGPEGGLSESERAALAGKGFQPVTLGRNILRTETAAAVFCAAIKLILAERDSWKPK